MLLEEVVRTIDDHVAKYTAEELGMRKIQLEQHPLVILTAGDHMITVDLHKVVGYDSVYAVSHYKPEEGSTIYQIYEELVIWIANRITADLMLERHYKNLPVKTTDDRGVLPEVVFETVLGFKLVSAMLKDRDLLVISPIKIVKLMQMSRMLRELAGQHGPNTGNEMQKSWWAMFHNWMQIEERSLSRKPLVISTYQGEPVDMQAVTSELNRSLNYFNYHDEWHYASYYLLENFLLSMLTAVGYQNELAKYLSLEGYLYSEDDDGSNEDFDKGVEDGEIDMPDDFPDLSPEDQQSIDNEIEIDHWFSAFWLNLHSSDSLRNLVLELD